MTNQPEVIEHPAEQPANILTEHQEQLVERVDELAQIQDSPEEQQIKVLAQHLDQ